MSGRLPRRALVAGGAVLAALPTLVRAREAAAATATAAQGRPHQPIRLVVPFAPGGATEPMADPVGAGVQDRLGQPVVGETRPGAPPGKGGGGGAPGRPQAGAEQRRQPRHRPEAAPQCSPPPGAGPRACRAGLLEPLRRPGQSVPRGAREPGRLPKATAPIHRVSVRTPGVGGKTRDPGFPEVPTFRGSRRAANGRRAGRHLLVRHPGPAGMPAEIVARPARFGGTPEGLAPEGCAAPVRREFEARAPVIAVSGAGADRSRLVGAARRS